MCKKRLTREFEEGIKEGIAEDILDDMPLAKRMKH
jgi:hypothetical protein